MPILQNQKCGSCHTLLYSLVETAKANGIKPSAYLQPCLSNYRSAKKAISSTTSYLGQSKFKQQKPTRIVVARLNRWGCCYYASRVTFI
ncbi:transposase domain-containing protein [Marinospirillum minutulum]|uniref:transposase domain-containing protein n=1 Tax=Marinospirillum minutulum TaxID=64974 RepID=UPI0012EBCFCF